MKYLTKEGFVKLKEELVRLERVGRKEAAQALKQAVSFGDISENAAYDAAREAYSMLESRISELKGIIANVKIIKKGGKQEVQIGSTVLLATGNGKEKFFIVGPEEADVLKGKISYQSPLGKLLLGKKKGEIVIMETPSAKVEYKILEIS